MISFEQYFREMNTAGPGGVFGNYADVGGAFPATGDSGYAPGDTRIPKILGARKKKNKKKIIPIQMRPLPGLEM